MPSSGTRRCNLTHPRTCQVDSDGGLKVAVPEVGGHVDDHDEEEGGQVGEEELADDLPPEGDDHPDHPQRALGALAAPNLPDGDGLGRGLLSHVKTLAGF